MVAAKERRSLQEYARDQKRKDCPICALPPDVLEELKGVGKRLKISRELQIAWVKEDVGVTITDDQLTNHYSGKHERA